MWSLSGFRAQASPRRKGQDIEPDPPPDRLPRRVLVVGPERGVRSPIGFARASGVRMTGTVDLHGISRGMCGSESWLISLGGSVHITAGLQFATHDGGTLILRKEVALLQWVAPIVVGDDVYPGIWSIVLSGVTIAARSIVAVGAVVSRDVRSNSVVEVVPARHICTVDEYLEKMVNKSLEIGHLGSSEKASRLRLISSIEPSK